jgi:hypothetical protein
MTKHGLTLSGGVGAAVVSQGMTSANVPLALIASTTNAASIIATMGQAVAVGMVSAKVAALTEGMMKTLFLTRLKFVMTMVIALSPVCVGWGAYQTLAATLKGSKEFVKSPGGIPPVAAPAKEDEKPDGENDKAIAGTVDDGEKSADHRQDKKTSPRVWKTDADGEDDLKRKFFIDRTRAIARGEAAFRKEGAGTEDTEEGKPTN